MTIFIQQHAKIRINGDIHTMQRYTRMTIFTQRHADMIMQRHEATII